MKLCFSVDALSSAGDHAWRLLEDGKHWRPSSFAEALQPGDGKLTDRETLQAWVGRRLRSDKEFCLIPKDKPGRFDFFMRGIFAHAIIHRLSSAPLPDREDLIQCMASSTPGTAWLIYLDLAGHFKALDTNKNRIIGNLDIAVRGEVASAEAYVGKEAASKAAYVDGLYHQFLAGWWEHLNSRRLSVFVPDTEKLEELDQIRQKILDWEPEACASQPPT